MMNLQDDDQQNEAESAAHWRLPHRAYVAGIGCATGVIVVWTLISCVLLYQIDGRPWWACAALAFMLVFWELWLARWIIGESRK